MAKDPKKGVAPQEIAPNDDVVIFEYIKSNFFRVIHSDGAIGGITPEGNIHLAFFSDRTAIPKMQIHKKNADGTLGDMLPEHTVARPGIIREMDVDIVLSADAAQAVTKWLSNHLAILNEIKKK